MQVTVLDSQPKPFYKKPGREFNRNQGRQPGILGNPTTDEAKPKWDDKLAALRSQRRAQGLCMKCGEKWGKQHKCPDKIALHVLEEFLDVIQPEQSQDVSTDASSDDDDEDMFVLSQCAIEGVQGKKTIKLSGIVDKQEILILIDSGSSCTFLSQSAATTLQCKITAVPPVSVTVANGQKITSDQQVSDFTWWTQGHTFTHSARVLPISCFDLVLGMDWLEAHSPMWIHWKRKLLRFTHNGTRISLKGIKDSLSSCPKLKPRKLKGLLRRGGIAQVVHLCPISSETPAPEDIPPAVQQLIAINDNLFQEPHGLPPARGFDHKIPLLPGVKPVNVKPYRYSPTQKDEIERQIKEMLANGIIRPSHSPFSSPVILVKKKDGAWRFCVDYRQLNNITVKDKYPLPIVDELLDELHGAAWFTKLDLCSGYHQIRVLPEDEAKTAFKTHHGHWEFRVMPFGLTNAPATFQALMNTIFKHLLRKCVLVFVDDILIYSNSMRDHLDHLTQVFSILHQHQLYLKKSKCSFAQQSLEYLGHIISHQGVSTDPKKTAAIANWPTPTDAKQLRSFLGLAGYYRKFIQGYGSISRPLTDLLKKHAIFQWTPQLQLSFDTLKQALVSAPVLALPDFTKGFQIETDASATGIGAVLSQNSHPIAYISKALGPKAQAMSTYEKECMALIMAVTKWKSYLQHREFIIATDHHSLIHLGDQKLLEGLQQKAFIKLLGLQYKIVHKKGADNPAADALSRKPDPPALMAVSTTTPKWLEIIVDGYQQDDNSKQLLTELALTGTNDKGFSLVDGIIKYKGRIWLGIHKEAHNAVLLALHSSGLGGHSGITATYQKIKALFAWPHMKQDVKDYIAACEVCAQAKSEHSKLPGLLQPLPIPQFAWHTISLDFIEGLPKSKNFDTILVVIDKLTKYAHFICLSHPYTAITVAQAFLANVYKLHGMPTVIISDRDRVFTSAFWQELFKLTDTTLNMSSSYHPQTDGQTERLNQCLETYLRCMVQSCPTKWAQWIPLAEFWYNSTYHSAHGLTPFQALYGHKPRHFGITLDDTCTVHDLKQWLEDRQSMLEHIQQNLQRAQNRMKHQADKNRQERTFQVGDWVYVKLQPYVQQSVNRRTNHKLSFKFFGPYLILQKVGPVAYKLQLPASSQIHPVIHVSQLKKALPPQVSLSDDNELNLLTLFHSLPPAQVLATRLQLVGRHAVPAALVQRQSCPPHWATWEPSSSLPPALSTSAPSTSRGRAVA
jgi:predicted amidophosphoribosyltransferase